MIRKQLRRGRALEFLDRQPRCVVAMEACSGAHVWGREIAKLDHDAQAADAGPVALASKMARIVWALMTKGEVYRAPAAAA